MEILPDSLLMIKELAHRITTWSSGSQLFFFTNFQNIVWFLYHHRMLAGVFFFSLCVLFYCQRLLAVWFIFKPRCHVHAWYGIREKENLSPSHCLLPLAMLHSEITKSNSVCQSSSPIRALKRSHLVQDLPRGMEDKTGLGMGYRVPQFPSVESGLREWVRILMRPSLWH